MEKAYKILSLKENISHRKAKEMLDLGLVYSNGVKLKASQIISPNIKLKIINIESPKIIFEDEYILAINKPAFFDSYDLENIYKSWVLLNRLDKHTSGVVLLTKENGDFRENAIKEFKNEIVYKEYLALVKGIVAEDSTITKPIMTKKGSYATSKIDYKFGKKAITSISPLRIINKNTLLKVVIKTGRTHQIRVHLNDINHPILGDNLYGKIPYERLMLHSYKIKLFDYEFCAKEGDFWKYLKD
ncbi:RNA pseudouridine synthase [Helicobacter sp. 16-1353]|uniref:pseudouridine synthase family protein n=1 Tax=Helicobacter sp. 16-1353 TaxID=2004996 RepID=UPI000DCB5A5E|nr:RluA family pseudouridine synthase [Helicobacter sp. 16-1353]RAX55265.1 RNA pseudouridine synthase [Helicobacter sp. 16-1353]